MAKLPGYVLLLVLVAFLDEAWPQAASDKKDTSKERVTSSAAFSLSLDLSSYTGVVRERLEKSEFFKKPATEIGAAAGGEVRWKVTWKPNPRQASLAMEKQRLIVTIPVTVAPSITLGDTARSVYHSPHCPENQVKLRFPIALATKDDRVTASSETPTVSGVGGCTLTRNLAGDIVAFFVPGLPKSVDISREIRAGIEAKAKHSSGQMLAAVSAQLNNETVSKAIVNALAQPLCLAAGVCLVANPHGVRVQSVQGKGQQLVLRAVVGIRPRLTFTNGAAQPVDETEAIWSDVVTLLLTLVLPVDSSLASAVIDDSVPGHRPASGYALLPLDSYRDLALLRSYEREPPVDVTYVRSVPLEDHSVATETFAPQEVSSLLAEIAHWLGTDALSSGVTDANLEHLRAVLRDLESLVALIVEGEHRLAGPAAVSGSTFEVITSDIHISHPTLIVHDVTVSEIGIEIHVQASAHITVSTAVRITTERSN